MVVLLSGGFDSVTMLHYYERNGVDCRALSFDYGQRHIKELEFAKKHCDDLGVEWVCQKINILGETYLQGGDVPSAGKSVVVPFRNLLFATYGAAFAIEKNETTIAFGCNKTDRELFPDCRKSFFESLQLTLNDSEGYNKKIQIDIPFLGKTKAQVAQVASWCGVKSKETWSCYAGAAEPCGVCGACKAMGNL